MSFWLNVTIGEKKNLKKKLKPTPMLVLWLIISFPRKSWQVKVGYMDIWPIVFKN